MQVVPTGLPTSQVAVHQDGAGAWIVTVNGRELGRQFETEFIARVWADAYALLPRPERSR